MSNPAFQSQAAIQDFRRARSRATMEDIIARMTGRHNDLLSYEDVKRKLRARESAKRELKDIPLDAIVGSVGRYADFNRHFLPRNRSDEWRWARVQAAVHSLEGVPPIDVYQIGNVYFVLDGNHRVSIARQDGASHIQAYVTPVQTRVPLSSIASPDDLILKAEYAAFLDQTHLDETRPEADLTVTNPGQYRAIVSDIEARREEMQQAEEREVALPEAAAVWYDTVYLPIVGIIRRQGLLRDFPDRTETDLYVWISRHRAELEDQLGLQIDPEGAANDLAARHSTQPGRVAARLSEALRDAVLPDALEAGPPPGDWRRTRALAQPQERLAADVLVPVNGAAEGWKALEQAFVIARREGGQLAGLHVVPTEAARQGEAAQRVREEFDRRCAVAGVRGRLILEVGGVTEQICSRARWADVVVVNLAYPPGAQPIDRLRSGFRALVQRCPRPILAVPGAVAPLDRALLAYDGSPKADEALYISAYLALQWGIPVVVVTVPDDETSRKTQARAREYLERYGVAATYIAVAGPVADVILKTAEQQAADLILIGGYGSHPLFEVVLGSTVDKVLRESRCPVLICR